MKSVFCTLPLGRIRLCMCKLVYQNSANLLKYIGEIEAYSAYIILKVPIQYPALLFAVLLNINVPVYQSYTVRISFDLLSIALSISVINLSVNF